MTDITVTDTPHGLHLDIPGAPGLTLGSDETTAIVQHELGKLGLWWAEEQRALVLTAPAADGYIVLLPDGVASGAHWTAVGAKASTPLDRRLGDAVAAYLATLPAEPELPKPGETWEIGTGAHHEFSALRRPDGIPVRVLLQRLGEREGPARAHVDIACRDRAATRSRHEELGAKVVAEGPRWSVMSDPVGRTYCLTDRDPATGRLPA